MTGFIGKSCRRAAGPAVAAFVALALAACASAPGARQIFLQEMLKKTEPVAAGNREHQRVLAAYGGGYEDPKLQAKLASVVERLVAASERAEMGHRVTIPHSPA